MASDKNFWPLVALKSLNWIPDSFLSTFMISYIMKFYENAIIPVVVYNIFFSIFVYATFHFACRFFKRTAIASIYQAGVIIFMIPLMTIILMGSKTLDYIWVMGAVYGAALGLTALGLNYMQTSLIKNQIKFSSYRTIMGSLVKVGFPALCGFLLGQYSFPQMAAVIFMVSLGLVLIAVRIREPKAPFTCPLFSLREFYAAYKKSKYRHAIDLCLLGEFFYGSNLVLNTVQTMLIIYLFKTDLSLGLINSALMFGLIFFRFLFGRFGTQKHFRPVLIVSLVLLAGCVTALIHLTEFNFLAFCLCLSLAIELIKLAYEPVLYTLFRIIPSYEKEFLTVREISINMGRIIMYAGLMGVAALPNIPVGLTYYAIFLVLTYMVATIMALGVNRYVRVS